MKKITQKEREKYIKVWTSDVNELTGELSLFLEDFFNYFKKHLKPGQIVSDFGCGQGTSLHSFLQHGLKVQLVDICRNCLSDPVKTAVDLWPEVTFFEQSLCDLDENVLPSDWIFCTFVLEHIPTSKIELVLKRIADRMLGEAFFAISLKEDSSGRCINGVLHPTARSEKWWLKKFTKYFQVQSHYYIESMYIIIRCKATSA